MARARRRAARRGSRWAGDRRPRGAAEAEADMRCGWMRGEASDAVILHVGADLCVRPVLEDARSRRSPPRQTGRTHRSAPTILLLVFALAAAASGQTPP